MSGTVTELLLPKQRYYHLYNKVHTQKYSLASMACQSVDSYRSHHMKPRTRAVLGACQWRLAVLPATSGSWVVLLRSCRQLYITGKHHLNTLWHWWAVAVLMRSIFNHFSTYLSLAMCKSWAKVSSMCCSMSGASVIKRTRKFIKPISKHRTIWLCSLARSATAGRSQTLSSVSGGSTSTFTKGSSALHPGFTWT